MADAKRDRLRSVNLFAGCDDKALDELASVLDEVDVEAGHELMREGMNSREAFFLIEGSADVTVGGKKVGEVHSGESAGEMGLLSKRLRSATVATTVPTKVYVLDGRRLDPILEKHPSLCLAMLETLSDRLIETDALLAEKL